MEDIREARTDEKDELVTYNASWFGIALPHHSKQIDTVCHPPLMPVKFTTETLRFHAFYKKSQRAVQAMHEALQDAVDCAHPTLMDEDIDVSDLRQPGPLQILESTAWEFEQELPPSDPRFTQWMALQANHFVQPAAVVEKQPAEASQGAQEAGAPDAGTTGEPPAAPVEKRKRGRPRKTHVAPAEPEHEPEHGPEQQDMPAGGRQEEGGSEGDRCAQQQPQDPCMDEHRAAGTGDGAPAVDDAAGAAGTASAADAAGAGAGPSSGAVGGNPCSSKLGGKVAKELKALLSDVNVIPGISIANDDGVDGARKRSRTRTKARGSSVPQLSHTTGITGRDAGCTDAGNQAPGPPKLPAVTLKRKTPDEISLEEWSQLYDCYGWVFDQLGVYPPGIHPPACGPATLTSEALQTSQADQPTGGKDDGQNTPDEAADRLAIVPVAEPTSNTVLETIQSVGHPSTQSTAQLEGAPRDPAEVASTSVPQAEDKGLNVDAHNAQQAAKPSGRRVHFALPGQAHDEQGTEGGTVGGGAGDDAEDGSRQVDPGNAKDVKAAAAMLRLKMMDSWRSQLQAATDKIMSLQDLSERFTERVDLGLDPNVVLGKRQNKQRFDRKRVAKTMDQQLMRSGANVFDQTGKDRAGEYDRLQLQAARRIYTQYAATQQERQLQQGSQSQQTGAGARIITDGVRPGGEVHLRRPSPPGPVCKSLAAAWHPTRQPLASVASAHQQQEQQQQQPVGIRWSSMGDAVQANSTGAAAEVNRTQQAVHTDADNMQLVAINHQGANNLGGGSSDQQVISYLPTGEEDDRVNWQDELLVHVAVFAPRRADQLSDDFIMLGSQPLSALADVIHCAAKHNLQAVGKNASGGSFFMIDGTFFNDVRDETMTDLSKPIINLCKRTGQLPSHVELKGSGQIVYIPLGSGVREEPGYSDVSTEDDEDAIYTQEIALPALPHSVGVQGRIQDSRTGPKDRSTRTGQQDLQAVVVAPQQTASAGVVGNSTSQEMETNAGRNSNELGQELPRPSVSLDAGLQADLQAVVRRRRKGRVARLRSEPMHPWTWGTVKGRVSTEANYVFNHLGCCEHLIKIYDVRAMHANDPASRSAYPMQLLKHRLDGPTRVARRCDVCSQTLANTVVYDDALASHNPSFYCDTCMKMLHPAGVGSGATAYPYVA